jgi:hypothetical protein
VLEERPGGTWRATYRLETETGFLRFQRPAAFYRETVWTVVTPGWELKRQEDEQVLVAGAGAATDTLVVEFPVYTQNIPKEYELFAEFTDGSVALYTGHLYVTTEVSEVAEEEAKFLRRVEMTPAAAERIVVQGEIFHGRQVWEDPHGDGTYVYFGGIDPVETADVIGIVDPGAPRWIVDTLEQALPELFALYTREFGVPLPWKPVVIFSFDDSDTPGLSSGGGTLTGLVQMMAKGQAWRARTSDSSAQLLYLIAHEAAHLWNGQIFSYEDLADSWMHEGSADAFASLVLRDQGAVDEQRLAERWTRALEECSIGLLDGPLADSADRSAFRNYYTCGEILAVWSAAVLPGDGGTGSLFTLWRKLFELADPATGKYGRQTYAEALSTLGANAASAALLLEFIDTEHADPAAALVDLMAAAGIALERPERPAIELRRDRAARALKHLMTTNCKGRYSYNTGGPQIRAFPIEGCDPFDREIVIVSIAGHDVVADGDRAFEAVAARCATGQDVQLGLESRPALIVACGAELAPLPEPLGFPISSVY